MVYLEFDAKSREGEACEGRESVAFGLRFLHAAQRGSLGIIRWMMRFGRC